MKFLPAIIAICFLLPFVAYADSDDDTLKLLLSKSDLVVQGKINTEPIGESEEEGVVRYAFDFEVSDVLKGDSELEDKRISVAIERFELDKKDRHPLIRKDTDCILLLKTPREGNISAWGAADLRFGVQQPSPQMAKSLKRLANSIDAAGGKDTPEAEGQTKESNVDRLEKTAAKQLARACKKQIDGTEPAAGWPETIRKSGRAWIVDLDTKALPGGYPEQIVIETTTAGGHTGNAKR